MKRLERMQPKVGVLALTLDLYETLAPGLREAREEWFRREILPALEPTADVAFDKAVFSRTDIEAQVGDLRDAYLYSVDDLREIVEEIGGGMRPGMDFKAAHCGGPSGGRTEAPGESGIRLFSWISRAIRTTT